MYPAGSGSGTPWCQQQFSDHEDDEGENYAAIAMVVLGAIATAAAIAW